MKVRVTTGDPTQVAADVLALPLFELDRDKWRLPSRLGHIDAALGGRLAAVLSTGDFRGRAGDTLTVYPDDGLAARRVVLVGLGREAQVDADALRRAAGAAVRATAACRGEELAFLAPTTRRLRPPAVTRALTEGAVLAGYRFEGWQESKPDAGPGVRQVTFLYERTPDARSARRGADTGAILAESQNLARELSNQPGNALPPAELAKRAQRTAKEVGLRCRVLGPAELKRRNMGGILAVGGGSANAPRLVVMEHGKRRAAGASRGRPTICLVGKGVTFDSGGISIKPAAGMGDMKHDMSGAAAVVGAMRAVALLKLPLHVVGILGAAENMPSGTAYRPGDLVRTMAGKSVEIVNTDAEGRVVLADALHFANTEFEPDAIVDLATLTGACVIALGKLVLGPVRQRRRPGGARPPGGRGVGRARLAHAALGRPQAGHQEPGGRPEERRRTGGGSRHGRRVPLPLRRRHTLGPSGHRRHRLDREDGPLPAGRRHRSGRATAA